MTNDPTSTFLDSHAMGESYDGVKFHQIGDKVVGTVVDTPKEIDTQYGARLLINIQATELVVDGQPVTDLAEPRSLWVKPGAMATATKSALSASKATGIGKGDTFGMAFTGEGTPSQPGFNPPKQYAAVHTAAQPTVDPSAVFGDASNATPNPFAA